MALFSKQPWIVSPVFDLLLIAGPPIFAGAVVLFFDRHFVAHPEVGPWAWLLLVVGIDVAHVYCSLFRTYFDASMRSRGLLVTVPLLCWAIGAVLYTLGPRYFWTSLAYVAVFHFVRQQYGLVMIYSRGDRSFRNLDRAAIYVATLYPLLFWHTHLPREFNWFVDGDFIRIASPWPSKIGGVLYVLVLGAYVVKEATRDRVNVPKNALVLGTALSWYVGIVWLNNDLAFTITNVVAHGIPYIALVWAYGRKAERPLFSPALVPIYVGILIVLAYLEEGLWDGFVWRDHSGFFPVFSALPSVSDPFVLALLVPMLALPQSTHYIFDGFIWRMKGRDSGWKDVLLGSKA